MFRRFAVLTLSALLAVATTACGPNDLDVAVADDVRGAPIDVGTPATTETDTSAEDQGAAFDPRAEDFGEIEEPFDTSNAATENGAATETAGAAVNDFADEDDVPIVLDDVAVADPIVDHTGDDPAGVDHTDDDPAGVDPTEDDATDVGMIGDVDSAPDGVEVITTDVPEDTAAAAAADDNTDNIDYADETDDWTPPVPEKPKQVDGVWYVAFDYLGQFDVAISSIPDGSGAAGQHTMAAEEVEEPKELSIETRKLHLETVEIEGYMIPLEFNDQGRVDRFFLSRYMMGCCFGIVPKANELIEVTMEDEKGAFYDAYMPIIARGVFEIRDDGGESKFLRSVFKMNAEECKFSDNW